MVAIELMYFHCDRARPLKIDPNVPSISSQKRQFSDLSLQGQRIAVRSHEECNVFTYRTRFSFVKTARHKWAVRANEFFIHG